MRMKNTIKKTTIMLSAVLALLLTFPINIYAAGIYVHDPMANPKAAKDIIEDPKAVYGYSPNPESARIFGTSIAAAIADYFEEPGL